MINVIRTASLTVDNPFCTKINFNMVLNSGKGWKQFPFTLGEGF